MSEYEYLISWFVHDQLFFQGGTKILSEGNKQKI